MSLTEKTKRLLGKYGLKPIHHRGQNFLINEKILDKIIAAADLKKEDVVLEVGPGLGFLTEQLAKKVKRVVAVELDKNLTEILKEELKSYKNIEIVQGDILKVNIENLPLITSLERRGQGVVDGYKVVANLPYNITSNFLRKFLETENGPSEMILMVQKEVAKRIIEKPGQMSLLSLSCQFYADCKIEFLVSKGNFLPSPKVDSAVIKLKLKNNPLCHSGLARPAKAVDPESLPILKQVQDDSGKQVQDNTAENLFKIAKIGFSSKRKKLIGNLNKGLKIDREKLEKILERLGLSDNVRAQELSVQDWINLTMEIGREDFRDRTFAL